MQNVIYCRQDSIALTGRIVTNVVKIAVFISLATNVIYIYIYIYIYIHIYIYDISSLRVNIKIARLKYC